MRADFIHQFYYLWSVALLIPLWAFIIYKKKKSRIEMIYMGIIFGTGALGLDKYCSFYDYWRPPTILSSFNFESFLYGFILGGISTKIFELVFKKDYDPQRNANSFFVLAIVLISVLLHMTLLGLFRLNSVDIYVVIMVIWVMVFSLIKRRLFIVSIMSGLLMTVLNFCWYAVIVAIYPDAIQNIWLTQHLSGLSIFNVPIEEHYYIFALGCFGSILFKVAAGSDIRVRESSYTRSNEPKQPDGKIKVWESRLNILNVLKSLKPYRLPIIFLLLVIGRMVIFGDARIPVGRIFNHIIP
jgi:hypothetical protein